MPSSPAAIADRTDAFPHVRGLYDYWARRTRQADAQPLPDMQARILLDMLGLGLEQTMRHVGIETPDYPTFEAWIAATAGLPDPDALDRYHAWLDGAPVPDATRRRLRAIEDAPPVLDAADLAHWDEHGYVIVRSAITADEAKAAETLLWRTVQARPEDTDSWYRVRNNGIMVQVFQDPALDAIRRSARAHKAFAQLWGTANLWSSVDRMSFNPPERPGRAFPGPKLHWDVSLTLPIPFATQGILYFTDTSANQGAFELVPGFHRGIESWLDGLGDADPRQVDLSAEAQRIAARAGDLIIWRHELPHGASPNSADRPRMAQYMTMYSPDYQAQTVWR